MNVKARVFKNNRQVMLYLDIKGTSGLDCPYIDIDTGWVNGIFRHLPEKAWDDTIMNMNIRVGYGTGDLWYSGVRTFEGSCRAEYILASGKPGRNNRRELADNPEDRLLDFDTVRETVFGMRRESGIDGSIDVKFDYGIIGGG